MAKVYRNLFENSFSIDALYAAYLDARKGKRNKKGIQSFESNLGINLLKLHEELHTGTYKPKPYKYFFVYEPKKRQIAAPDFRDTIVQHAIYKTIYPIFDKTFIYQSYGCRKLKGTHLARDKAQEYMRSSASNSFVAQYDIRKYYYSISLGKLKQLICKKIKDTKFLQVIFLFIPGSVGVPIGNLLSQLYALIYLNPFDHFIKRVLKIKKYVRYVDDFILIHASKEETFQCKSQIEEYLKVQLGLELSSSKIYPIRKGINFVGFRIWRNKRFVRKHSLYSFTKAVKAEKIDSANSILGHALRTSSFNSMCKKLKLLKPCLTIPIVEKYYVPLSV